MITVWLRGVGARPPVCGWTLAAADDVLDVDDDVTAAADVVLAAAALAVLLVVAAALAVLLVVAAAELVAGADVVTAVVVAGAAEDVDRAADDVAPVDDVAAVVDVGLPQAASSDAPIRLAAPLSANWITWRRRNGAPVIGWTSDILTVYLLDGNTTHAEVQRRPADYKRTVRPGACWAHRWADNLLSIVYASARRQGKSSGRTGMHNSHGR
ncbi:MAG TPA: hypothetical protein VGP33_14060 [Chloroflexota bacterium]|nr:hypothetical protein [Chloroflexota bacterium]